MVGGARADTRVKGWAFRFEFARPRIASCSDCDGSWAGGVYLPLVVRGSAADVSLSSLLYIINTTAEANLSVPWPLRRHFLRKNLKELVAVSTQD